MLELYLWVISDDKTKKNQAFEARGTALCSDPGGSTTPPREMKVLQGDWSAEVKGQPGLGEAGEGQRCRLVLKELRTVGMLMDFR